MKGFGSDNHSGIHPRLIQAMQEANQGHAPSYGTDTWTELAQKEFDKLFGRKAPVFFVYNGTAANVLSARTLVKPWQSILVTDLSHMNVDECGAPEFFAGCKLVALPSTHGKITLEQIKKALIRRGDQHFSQVKAISLTQPTELGTVYTTEELSEIAKFAHAEGLFLHIDGARIANAIVRLKTDFASHLSDTGVDILSFGGTKNGLMVGEAVVFLNAELAREFVYIRKQSAQLPSKTRFISAPFTSYLATGLWKEIAEHSLAMAQLLFNKVKDIAGVEVTMPVQSNAVFAKIPQKWVKPLREKYFFYVWDEKSFECRWMTSFDTTREDVEGFEKALRELSGD